VRQAVSQAVVLLEDIGALEEGSQALTVLGRHLAALPLPPRIGKLLLYGILFRCLDPLLTVACCMAYRCATFATEDPMRAVKEKLRFMVPVPAIWLVLSTLVGRRILVGRAPLFAG
jgi:HrpA-like RNA helicase